MARHWIITNREVGRKRENGSLVERVIDTRREALPVFRVGSLDIATGHAPTPEEMHAALEIVPDTFLPDYSALGPTDDPASLTGSSRLFVSLYQQMLAAAQVPPGANAQAKKGDTLFFIHGFNYEWQDALEHLLRLHRVYVEPAHSPISQILYFSWPSYGSGLRYPSDQRIAQPSGALLGRVFGKAVDFYREFFSPQGGGAALCGRKIHFAAHSMGNQVMQEFMRTIREYDHLRLPMFGEVLLLHADSDWTALEDGLPLSVLPDYSQRVHVYNHVSDNALSISETTKNEQKRLGKHGPRDMAAIPPRVVVADCSALNGKADTRNATDADVIGADAALRAADGRPFGATAESVGGVGARERLFDHWGYLHRAEQVADIYKVLRGESSGLMPTRLHVHGQLYRLKAVG